MANLTMQIEDVILPAPVQFRDIKRENIALDYAASSTGLPRLDRGFCVKMDTAGEIKVITLAQFRRALFNKSYGVAIANPFKITDAERNSLLGKIRDDANEGKITIQLAANQWSDTPLVFLESDQAADLTVDIGII